MQKVYRAIGARIRSLRLGLKMTQAEVAERAGIDASFYGQLERGANTPSLRTLYSVAAVLQVEPAELLPKARAARSDDPLMTGALSALLKRLRPERRRFLLGMVRDLADELKR
jgi:transcriptional regulator with XRE-family HTH domain